ncbi:MAG: recombination protein RecR [Ruminococcaceae bacterium]|nr:recombination protein RecR [Oscillospiraceae bacterium]
MSEFIAPLEMMIEAFRRLPGVGRKSAERMAFGILDMTEGETENFLAAVSSAKKSIRPCSECGNITAEELCPICANPERDRKIICVVEDSKAVISFEKIKEFGGVYHVLGGVISPRSGKGPDSLNLFSLSERIKKCGAEEVMIATNATVEGETTAMYISRLIKPTGVRITRLAYGIPVGADIEYADKLTLLRAIEGRREF